MSLDLSPEVEHAVRERAAAEGVSVEDLLARAFAPECADPNAANGADAEDTPLVRAVRAMTDRTSAEAAQARARAAAAYLPRRTVAPGTPLADVVSGKWPGDETDARIEAALRELS